MELVGAGRRQDRGTNIYAVNLDGPCDILDCLCAQICEGEVELVQRLIADNFAHVDRARLRQSLQTRRDIDTIAVNVVAIDDDVSDIDANAKVDSGLG